MPTAARDLALELLRTVPEADLATCEGDQPRVRPVSIAAVEGSDVFVASFAHWGKVAEVTANPRVELSFMDAQKRHVRLTGTATLVGEASEKHRIWESFPMMQGYFPTADDPRYALLRVEVARVRVKDAWELEYREVEPVDLGAHPS